MTPVRYHSLDNLRAFLMLLGIVLHAACSYVTFPLGEAWTYKDVAAVHPAFDLVSMFVHVFRMPLFFLLAGFFARLMLERRGANGLLQNRFRRIAIPFLVGWAVLYVPTRLAFFYGQAHPGPQRFAEAWSGFEFRETLMHLWFLNYLLWFYAATLVGVWLLPRVAPRLGASVQRSFRSIAATPFRAFGLAVPSIAALWFMKTGTLDTSMTLIPELQTLLAYALFYFAGWLLYGEADLLGKLPRFAWTQTILGLLLVPVTLTALLSAGPPPIAKNTPQQLIAIMAGGFSVWLLLFGITGLFLRYGRNTSRRMAYLADASYWMYLAHLPVVIWLHVLLESWKVSGLVKFPVVVGVTVPVLLVSYELLVRRTFIGAILNGKAVEAGPSKVQARAAGAS